MLTLLRCEELLLVARGRTWPLLLRDADEGRPRGLPLDGFHRQVWVLKGLLEDPVRELSDGLGGLSGALRRDNVGGERV